MRNPRRAIGQITLKNASSGEARSIAAELDRFAAKLATLEYRVVQRLAGGTLVELSPKTGRMHQLRVQAAWRGHPVYGDVMYGGTRAFGPAWENPRDKVIALHARRLELDHPFTGGRLTFEAPVPGYWADAGVTP